ncbi:MAG TPA: hypothetical protein VGP25_12530 [Gemmatimonadaceae bacterium]|jgi:hypothetical protein|nr:hypothetical protein [Gemmatimonadaceae bacterium]
MSFSLSRWRPRHLFLAWIAYWIVLLAASLGTAVRHALIAVAAPEGHGSIGVSMNDGVLSLLVKSDTLTYTTSASLLSIALWIAGPPLLLWALWVATRTHPAAARERVS